jgi:predicted HicB family RNase H-like nuclease
MTKKSFRGPNPALQYISHVETDNTDNKYITDNTDYTDNTQEASNTLEMYNKHKNHYTHDTHYKQSRETKSKRLNLLLQPSLLGNLTKIARMRQTSVNDLINTVMRKYVEQESDIIGKYEEIFGERDSEGINEH